MRIKTNRNVGRILLAGACAAALAAGSAVPAFAVEKSGTTNVTYSSSSHIPGTKGWGFEIPTSIPFGIDKLVAVDATVNLYNINPGSTVDDIPDADIPASGVKLHLKSANGFKLQKADGAPDPVAYRITYTDSSTTPVTPNVFDESTGAAGKAIGTFTKENHTMKGEALRTGNAKESGVHVDTLTFSYDDETGA